MERRKRGKRENEGNKERPCAAFCMLTIAPLAFSLCSGLLSSIVSYTAKLFLMKVNIQTKKQLLLFLLFNKF